jgi:hypothetical protein
MRALVLAVTLLVAACATGEPLAPPATVVPDLRGTWTGTWGGTPLTLIVTDQGAGHGESGVVIGPWQLLGQPYPTMSGIITVSIRGAPVSTRLDGLLGDAGGRLVVTIRARSSAGEQRLTLRLVETDRLEGRGDSQYGWGPQGPVRLVRQARPNAAGGVAGALWPV